jgi:N6-adenosine-specific RNA methylase IME4
MNADHEQITVCAKCSGPAEFGYKIKGELQWLCEQHRLSQNYADARAPKPEQKTESKQVARPLQFHPLAEIFPLIEGQEFDELVADIKAHGIREPIWIYDGRIIDGRNRYRAASAAGIECPVRRYTGADPVSFVISLNLKRRHLNESQRAMVAAKLANLQLGDNQHSKGLPIGRGSELLNVGERSVARAKVVREHGADELISAVERGQISVSAASDVASKSADEQREIVARGERQILEAAKAIRAERAESRRAERIAKIAEISNVNAPLPQDRKYPIIYADPPWSYEHPPFSESRKIENHYPTLSLEAICSLPIAQLATENALLFIWTPPPILEQCFQVIRDWGFEYRTGFVWTKDKIGMGMYLRQQHEHLLICRRGEIPLPPPNARPSSVIQAPRREHSRKPDEAYALIEQMYPELPKIELFARGLYFSNKASSRAISRAKTCCADSIGIVCLIASQT